MSRRSAIVLLACTLAYVARGQSATQSQSSVYPAIKVMAIDDRTQKRIAGAHVFVMSTAGKQIAEAWTNQQGIAEIADVSQQDTPKYLFVEAPWSFITGREWIEGQLEYRIPLIGLTPPGFSG